MHLKWAHYCIGIQPNGWGIDVIYKIDFFGADPGKPLQLPPFPVHLGVRVHAPAGTNPAGHVLQAVLQDTNGQALSDTRTVPLEFITLPASYPLVGLGLVPLNNWPMPSIGSYTVTLAADDVPIGEIPFVINRRQGRVPPPGPAHAPPLRLEWAHYVMGVGVHPNLPGGMNLAGVFEFLPRVMGSNLKGSLLLLQIESDLTIHTQRELRVELLDSKNQPARDENGRLIMPALIRPITLRRQSPAWDFLVSTATVRFEEDLSLAPGEYHFRFSVDGQQLGEPLGLTVVAD